jgi:hypothetical protein
MSDSSSISDTYPESICSDTEDMNASGELLVITPIHVSKCGLRIVRPAVSPSGIATPDTPYSSFHSSARQDKSHKRPEFIQRRPTWMERVSARLGDDPDPAKVTDAYLEAISENEDLTAQLEHCRMQNQHILHELSRSGRREEEASSSLHHLRTAAAFYGGQLTRLAFDPYSDCASVDQTDHDRC